MRARAAAGLLAVALVATACGARLTSAQRDAALGGLVNDGAGPSAGPQSFSNTGQGIGPSASAGPLVTRTHS